MTDYTRVVDGVPIIEDRVRVSGEIQTPKLTTGPSFFPVL